MLDILTTCTAPAPQKGLCGILVHGHPVPGLPGLFLIDPVFPLDAHDAENGVDVIHGATGRRLTSAENGNIAARRMTRLAAVSTVFGIDWEKRTPVLKRDRRRMAAVRWALDPVAAMFNAPCPDAVETIMAEGLSATVPDATVRVLLG